MRVETIARTGGLSDLEDVRSRDLRKIVHTWAPQQFDPAMTNSVMAEPIPKGFTHPKKVIWSYLTRAGPGRGV